MISQNSKLSECFHSAFIHIKSQNYYKKQDILFKNSPLDDFLNEAQQKYPTFMRTSFLTKKELKERINEYSFETDKKITKKFFELRAYQYFCKLSILIDSKEKKWNNPFRLIRLIEKFYITIFKIYLDILSTNSTIYESLLANEMFRDLRQECAEKAINLFPALKAFSHSYQTDCHDDIKSVDFMNIIKVRSGIECLPEVFDGIKIEADGNYYSFKEYYDVLRKGCKLEFFDKNIALWKDKYKFEITEKTPKFLDLKKHFWWRNFSEIDKESITYSNLNIFTFKAESHENISKSFNDPKYSDLKFKIEDKLIYVNKSVLQTNSKYFKSKWADKSKGTTEKVIEIKEYSYDVYYAFLEYLYTDSVDIFAEKALDLLILANDYKEEKLKQKCLDIITKSITIENVCTLYCFSIRNKWNELENQCFEFAFNSLREVKKTEAFRRMDENTFKTFKIKVYDKQNE
jgi:RCC1 and BTB domain-containing protein